MPEQDAVLREDVLGITTLTLNRGSQYNPLSTQMMQALHQQITNISLDASIKAVILKGSGKGFCSGHDLKEMNAHRDQVWLTALFKQCKQLMHAIMDCPKPVIAQVHGIATAAGCQLTSVCDLAIASSETKFALPGVNVGLFCSTPAVGVSRNIARKRVMEMLLTGEAIDARTALNWGLVNDVVPLEDLDDAVNKLADRFRHKSSEVIALGKKGFYQQMNCNLADAYDLAAETMVCNMMLDDNIEGIDAFLNKRKPNWKT